MLCEEARSEPRKSHAFLRDPCPVGLAMCRAGGMMVSSHYFVIYLICYFISIRRELEFIVQGWYQTRLNRVVYLLEVCSRGP